MSTSSKVVAEKNNSGEWKLTGYGEFLSYFHTHLELFKRFGKEKQFTDAENADKVAKLKSLMTAKVKKTEQFMELGPEFANLLGVKPDEIGNYLQKNFLTTLPKIQTKLIEQEKEKNKNPFAKSFAHIGEELVARTGFSFPEGFRFFVDDGIVSLRNESTGESYVGANTTNHPEKTEATKESAKKKDEPKTYPDPPILKDILSKFGESLTGQKLEVVAFIAPEEDVPVQKKQKKNEGELEEIDLEFEDIPDPTSGDEDMDVEEEDESSDDSLVERNHPPDLGDLAGILGNDSADDLSFLDEVVPSTPKEDAVSKWTLKEFIEFTNLQKQKSADNNVYASWVKTLGDVEKSSLSLRMHLTKEKKGESVSWDGVFQNIASQTSLSKDALSRLKEKLNSFSVIRTTLDGLQSQFIKANPEFLKLAKSAWPHLQDAFLSVPDFGLMETKCRNLVNKIPNEMQKQEMIKYLGPAINYVKKNYTP